MTILTDLIALLRRPITEPAQVASTKGRPKLARAEDVPLTEGELTAALAQCAEERAAAWTLIESAGDRREALLLVAGSDDEILQLGEEVDRANIVLDRLAVLEPSLRGRLAAVQHTKRAAAFVEARDTYVAAGRAYVAAHRAFDPARQSVQPLAALGRLLIGFPDVREHVPAPPLPVEIGIFERRLDEFATLALKPIPEPS